MNLNPGIRQPVYLAGQTLTIGPEAVKQSVAYAETVDYAIDTTPLTDRALAWGTDTEMAPDVVRKFQFELDWQKLTSADFLTFHRVMSQATTFDLCIWKPIIETFTCDGVKSRFRLSGADAVYPSAGAPSFLTHPGPTGYDALLYVNGTPLSAGSTVSLLDGTRDVNGRQAFTAGASYGPTVPHPKGTLLEMLYVPLFLTRRAGAESQFPPPMRETFILKLEAL